MSDETSATDRRRFIFQGLSMAGAMSLVGRPAFSRAAAASLQGRSGRSTRPAAFPAATAPPTASCKSRQSSASTIS